MVSFSQPRSCSPTSSAVTDLRISRSVSILMGIDTNQASRWKPLWAVPFGKCASSASSDSIPARVSNTGLSVSK